MTLEIAKHLDKVDPLKKNRALFHLPEINNQPTVYFCGNSLGLAPKKAKPYLEAEFKEWSNLGVEGHFHAKSPWLNYHQQFSESLANLVGAKKNEVIAMNSLTVNLHLMLTTFYRPTAKRFKIITEAGSFPSDLYALESQIKLHGLNPKKVLIEIKPRKGEYCLRTEDIEKQISKHKKDLALVMMGGVNYYTGQLLDMAYITKVAKKAGAKVGFDLAHAIGNVSLNLHKWDVDFAVWCSYKYLNSGPGAVGGAFLHEKHGKNKALHRLAGWWGNLEKNRFQMNPTFQPTPSIEGWQLSNAPVFNMIAHKASLEIFDAVGIKALIRKSRSLTGLLEKYILTHCTTKKEFGIKIITPGSIDERGCQLSILVSKNGEKLFQKITEAGFVVDWRSPNVIRVAPTPLYNTHEEVFLLGQFLSQYCHLVK